MCTSFCSIGLLGSKLFPEIISAILSRHAHPPINKLPIKTPPTYCSWKQALNAGNGGLTRWDCSFLTPSMPKRTEMALPVPTRCGHAVCTFRIHPPTSPYPALSAEAEHISKRHCQKWHREAESLMTYTRTMGPKELKPFTNHATLEISL